MVASKQLTRVGSMIEPEQWQYYSPFKWTVRVFREGETAESSVFFRPDGSVAGFHQHVPETTPGTSRCALVECIGAYVHAADSPLVSGEQESH